MAEQKPHTKPAATYRDAKDWRSELSPRQQEIMALLADGWTNKDIGHSLGLTEGTIKQHLAAIFRKLGVPNRTWAASLWRDQGAGLAQTQDSHHRSQAPICAPSDLIIAPARLFAVNVLRLPADAAQTSALPLGQLTAQFLAIAQRWGRAYEGQVGLHPGGHLIGCFGYPAAHIDDVERAMLFGQAVQAEAEQRLGLVPCCSFAAAIDMLTIQDGLVVDTEALRQALATAFAKTAEDQNLISSDMPFALSGGPNYAAAIDRAARTMPALETARRSLADKRSCWLAVEAWPPIHGKHFLDAFATANPIAAKMILHLRPSGDQTKDAASLPAQIEAQIREPLSADTRGKSLSWWLEYLGQRSPVLVLVHGSRDLDSFRRLLDDALIARLTDLPIMFLIGALPLRGAPRLAIRKLGVFGERPIVGRVHEIALPDDGFAAATGYPDICALIDQTGPADRGILSCLADHALATPAFIARTSGLALPEVKRALDRLDKLGLISHSEDGRIRLRDDPTRAAVQSTCLILAYRTEL